MASKTCASVAEVPARSLSPLLLRAHAPSLPSAYVSIRQHKFCIRQHTSACVSARQHKFSIRQRKLLRAHAPSLPSAYVSVRQHASACVSIRQHT